MGWRAAIWRGHWRIAALLIPAVSVAAAEAPRVMSLNVCTDQLVLALAEPAQIVSLSELSDDPSLSHLQAAAAVFPKNKGMAEEVLLARPEVVVTGTYSLHNTTDLMRRVGVRIEEFDYAQTLASIPADIRRMGAILGRAETAAAQAAAFEAELARLSRPVGPDSPTIIVYGQNGVVLGADTLADSVIAAAGFRNLAAERGVDGMAPYALELLIADRPDMVLVSQPYAEAPALADQIARHPALAALGGVRLSDALPRAAWACGGPFTLEALRALRRLRDGFDAGEGAGG